MGSLTEHAQTETCDACQRPAEALFKRGGDRLCSSCKALFWTAEVLFDSEIADEAAIIATMAFAVHTGKPDENYLSDELVLSKFEAEFAYRYPAFELITIVDGVPVLRMKPALVDVVRYPSSALPKQVRVEVLSKHAEPGSIAELYRRTLIDHKLPMYDTSPGRIEWEYKEAHLVINVGPKESIHPTRVASLEEYPQVYRFSFPLPSIVGRLCEGLMGSPTRARRRSFLQLVSATSAALSTRPRNRRR